MKFGEKEARTMRPFMAFERGNFGRKKDSGDCTNRGNYTTPTIYQKKNEVSLKMRFVFPSPEPYVVGCIVIIELPVTMHNTANTYIIV